MSQIKEYIKIALMNISSNRGRSILTMLGIIIGISSVIMIISIGNGVQGSVNDGLNSIAGGQIYLYADNSTNKTSIRFDEEDMEQLRNIDHVIGVTDAWSFYGIAKGHKGEFDAMVSAGNTALQYLDNVKMKTGRFFNESDYLTANKVCVISETDANKLFGTDNVLGMEIDVSLYGITQTFTIIGTIQKNEDSAINSLLYDDRVTVEVPLTVIGGAYGFYIADTESMYVISEGPEYSVDVANKAIAILENRKGVRGQNIIQMQNFNDVMGEVNGVIDTVKIFIVFVAAVSLLVGGIGVMNIMLVSVSERTREIGIRKSLGARTSSILLQFLSESAIIALVGGIIGIAIGIGGAALVCTALKFKVSIDIGVIIFASLFSSGIGIVFGVYPAKKAAKLRPIDALRHE